MVELIRLKNADFWQQQLSFFFKEEPLLLDEAGYVRSILQSGMTAMSYNMPFNLRIRFMKMVI